MNQAMYIVLLLGLQAFIAYLFGIEMKLSNPDGVWLYTPPADGSGSPSNPFYVGSSIGMILVSLTYVAASVSIYTWAKLKRITLSRLFFPLTASSVVGIIITLAIGELAW